MGGILRVWFCGGVVMGGFAVVSFIMLCFFVVPILLNAALT